jgi:universal stress protein A
MDDMTNSKPIVFSTDFSRMSLEALPWAKRMAVMLGTKLHCIYAVEEPHIYATLDMPALPVNSIEELEQGARARMSAFIAEHLKDLDEKPVTAVLIGRPADEIADYAKKVDAAMLVMATHGYSGVKHVVLGSTTEAVLRHASCPVLSIRGSSN